MKLRLDIDAAAPSSPPEEAPDEDDIRRWITAALAHRLPAAEVSLRLVDEAEMAALNRRYRGGNAATNVLSFPAELPRDIGHPLLGDIVLCPAVVRREALAQGKSGEQHWAHLLVHGSLHLLGYDHGEAGEAARMEALETEILGGLGYPCPYGGSEEARAPAGVRGK